MTLTTRTSILVVLPALVQTASAQNPIGFTYRGEITSIDFGSEYLNGAYTVGQTITGSVTGFP